MRKWFPGAVHLKYEEVYLKACETVALPGRELLITSGSTTASASTRAWVGGQWIRSTKGV
jgi:hypothetical protein